MAVQAQAGAIEIGKYCSDGDDILALSPFTVSFVDGQKYTGAVPVHLLDGERVSVKNFG